MNKICISTLTHDAPDRADSLRKTIENLYHNYEGPKIDWYILSNGYNKDIKAVTQWAVDNCSDKFRFDIELSTKNLGVGGGINRLNSKHDSTHEYTFFLEGDWINLPHDISGHSKNWFWNAVNLLDENPSIDQVQFRRYLDELDDRQYGYGFWIKEKNFDKYIENGDKWMIVKEREYVNNPVIRRNSKFYDLDIFPLGEYFDEEGKTLETKENPETWGRAEIEAVKKSKINAAWLMFGNFVHAEHFTEYGDDWEKLIASNLGCGKYKFGVSTCKYGYLFTRSFGGFCYGCSLSEDIHQHEKHQHRYEREILRYEREDGDEVMFKEIDKIVDDPTIPVNKRKDFQRRGVDYFKLNQKRKQKEK